MQNEDDLRGLAKVMDFMRAISILFVVINIYWFCYQSFREWGINIGVVDKILLNFQRTAGLFSNILYTKLFRWYSLRFPVWVQKEGKRKKITWNKIYVFLTIGFILVFPELVAAGSAFANGDKYKPVYLYHDSRVSLAVGCRSMDFRLLKNNLMDDVFNTENESLRNMGNTPDRKRVFHQPADTVLLQKEME